MRTFSSCAATRAVCATVSSSATRCRKAWISAGSTPRRRRLKQRSRICQGRSGAEHRRRAGLCGAGLCGAGSCRVGRRSVDRHRWSWGVGPAGQPAEQVAHGVTALRRGRRWLGEGWPRPLAIGGATPAATRRAGGSAAPGERGGRGSGGDARPVREVPTDRTAPPHRERRYDHRVTYVKHVFESATHLCHRCYVRCLCRNH